MILWPSRIQQEILFNRSKSLAKVGWFTRSQLKVTNHIHNYVEWNMRVYTTSSFLWYVINWITVSSCGSFYWRFLAFSELYAVLLFHAGFWDTGSAHVFFKVPSNYISCNLSIVWMLQCQGLSYHTMQPTFVSWRHINVMYCIWQNRRPQ